VEIEILQVIKNNEPTTKVKGWVHLRLQKRMEVYMTILEGKNTLFLKAPSVKIDGEFKPSYAWMNEEVMKKIHHEVTPTLKEKLLDKTPQFPF
jgi:DNA-binding cell septation regulator SpoVG